MTEPNGAPAPDENEKPQGIPEIDAERRLVNLGYTVARPFAPGEVFVGTAPWWKIKQLAAQIMGIESNMEAMAQQAAEQKVVPVPTTSVIPEHIRRKFGKH
jgi:hypothetical protein